MLRLSTALMAVFLCLVAGFPAKAGQCGSRAQIKQHLTGKYHEIVIARGIVKGKTLMELFVSEKNGTWTIALTSTAGVTCLLGAGDNWQPIKPPKPGNPS